MLIARVLNHASLQHTHIYTRLNTAPVAKALNIHTEQILGYAAKRIVHTEEPEPVPAPPPVLPVARSDGRAEPINATPVQNGDMEWPG